jgi:DNA ligase-1
LASVYDDASVDLADYWVSEKYDGIRAYWNGKVLLTRAGNVIHAPAWFVAGWPGEALDGELWVGRGQFESLMGIVRDGMPNDSEWRRVRFMVFDLPAHAGAFTDRIAALKTVLATIALDWVKPVEQWRIADEQALAGRLREVVSAGGEGLMLHRAASLYLAERNDDLLKLKRYRDAEARVIGYVAGKGKYEGMLGSLEVQRPDGVTFRIGTGFDDQQRRDPPKIGAWVTYRYAGLTANGIPRFASFVRVREESSPPIRTPL